VGFHLFHEVFNNQDSRFCECGRTNCNFQDGIMTVFAAVFWAEFEKVDRKIHSVPEIVENPFHPRQPRPKTGRFGGCVGGFSSAFCGGSFTFCRRFVILEWTRFRRAAACGGQLGLGGRGKRAARSVRSVMNRAAAFGVPCAAQRAKRRPGAYSTYYIL
jgi:hypothetical protein